MTLFELDAAARELEDRIAKAGDDEIRQQVFDWLDSYHGDILLKVQS